jgi:urease accessory protein
MYRRIEGLLGNLRDFPVGERSVERIPVESSAMTRRLLRLPSSIGDLGIWLGGERLRDGDVLVADAARVIAVAVTPDDVLIAYPASIAQAVEIAHALGNRHIPVLRDGDAVVTAYSAPIEELFARAGVRFERAGRVLDRPFVYANVPHSHA